MALYLYFVWLMSGELSHGVEDYRADTELQYARLVQIQGLTLPSVGTAEAAILTTSSLKGSGAVLSMRRYISTTMTPLLQLHVD